MLLLTESTLFFVNLLRSSSRGEQKSKAQVLAKVKQWTTRVQAEQQAASQAEPQGYAPSTSTMTEQTTVSSTVFSGVTQSSAATTLIDEECDIKMGEKDTLHGGFGEDGDDSQEREDTVEAGAGKRVSVVQ